MIISFPSCRLKILMLIVIPLQGEPLKLKTRVLLFERDKLDGGMGFLTFLNEGFLFLFFFFFFSFFSVLCNKSCDFFANRSDDFDIKKGGLLSVSKELRPVRYFCLYI